jgi:hypothetical protein
MGEIPRMKLYALIPVYNSRETIYDCLVSVARVVDKIVICEGRWIGFEGKSVVSDDGTDQEIERFLANPPTVAIEWQKANVEVHQFEARNSLLDQVPVGDWFLMIDSDEFIIKIPENLREILENTKETVNGYRTGQRDETQVAAKPLCVARLLRKTNRLHYTTNHRYLEDDNGNFDTIHCPELPELVIMHKGKDKASRPAMQNYKMWRNKWELQQKYNKWLFEWEKGNSTEEMQDELLEMNKKSIRYTGKYKGRGKEKR